MNSMQCVYFVMDASLPSLVPSIKPRKHQTRSRFPTTGLAPDKQIHSRPERRKIIADTRPLLCASASACRPMPLYETSRAAAAGLVTRGQAQAVLLLSSNTHPSDPSRCFIPHPPARSPMPASGHVESATQQGNRWSPHGRRRLMAWLHLGGSNVKKPSYSSAGVGSSGGASFWSASPGAASPGALFAWDSFLRKNQPPRSH